MYPGHHKIYNFHALDHITKRVEVPLAEIGVGEGETLEPVNNRFKYPSIIKPVMEPEIATASYEYSQIDGFSDPVNETHFPKSFNFGQAIEGWGY